MKILKIILLCSIPLMGLISAKAQTADEIVNKWMDAMGGRDKLSSMQTVYTENEINIMNNIAPGKTYIVNGKGFKSETDFNGQKVIDCYTVNNGWSINPLAGQNAAATMPAVQIKLGQLQLDAAGPLFNYAAKGSKAELLGKELLKGTSVYKLKLTTSAGLEVTFFINDTSYYILKEVTKMNAEGQDIEITVVNSDYRKTENGFIMPFSTELTLPGLTATINNRKIEINKEIDPAIFEMPKN
jgi:outer membrane lipoprotein-sorting protein